MGFLIGLLTFVLVVDCIVLVFLVLIQLPKKEAGAGLAFGGAATDALFGAGSGNVLTKITKYGATVFFVLAILLAIMQRYYVTHRGTQFQKMLEQPGKAPVTAPASSANTPTPSTPAVAATNITLTTGATNLLPVGTNVPVEKQ